MPSLPLRRLLLFGLPVVALITTLAYTPQAPQDASRLAATATMPDSAALNRLAASTPPTHAAPSMTQAEALQQMAALYGRQAEMLAAEARGDDERAAELLDEAVGTLRRLRRHPEVAQTDRFRTLLRTFASEYQTRYGTLPDSLELPGDAFFAERDRLFAALEGVDQPLLSEAAPPDVQAVRTEVPLPMNRLVQGAIRFLLREPEDHVYPWMRRAATYFPMIEQVFAEEGVPDELKYLALVESGLRPRARSWASAAGPWQFMQATGEAYGLEVDAYVDERLDPEKATRAAARHLLDLHSMFGGDWLIALAGYNLSPTKVRAAVRKARARIGHRPTFWDIYPYLPRETRNYVPTFVAAALVVSNPAAFDLDHVLPGPRFRYDEVPVRGLLPLEAAARLAGTDVATLRRLNPELRKNTLPPRREPYRLRIPYDRFERFRAGYAELSPDERGAVATHSVHPGEALHTIARRYEMTVAEVMDANGLRTGQLQPGQTLVLPLAGTDTTASADALPVDVAEAAPRRVDYGARMLRPIAGVETRGRNAGQPLLFYRVRPGDTLTEIAQRHDVSVRDLKRWNGLRSSSLQPGQQLKVYGQGS